MGRLPGDWRLAQAYRYRPETVANCSYLQTGLQAASRRRTIGANDYRFYVSFLRGDACLSGIRTAFPFWRCIRKDRNGFIHRAFCSGSCSFYSISCILAMSPQALSVRVSHSCRMGLGLAASTDRSRRCSRRYMGCARAIPGSLSYADARIVSSCIHGSSFSGERTRLATGTP